MMEEQHTYNTGAGTTQRYGEGGDKARARRNRGHEHSSRKHITHAAVK